MIAFLDKDYRKRALRVAVENKQLFIAARLWAKQRWRWAMINEEGVASAQLQRSVVAALIVICRYLDNSSTRFCGYLDKSIEHASASGVSTDDLALLRTMLTSIKGKNAIAV